MTGLDDLLLACPRFEPATFWEFLNELPDRPEKGDKAAWRQLFTEIRDAEDNGFISVSRLDNNIETLQLTEAGFQKLRELR